jgi:hypothetical protein
MYVDIHTAPREAVRSGHWDATSSLISIPPSEM